MNRKYRLTALACYVGYVGQAVICNFQPLLFLTFERTWGITPAKLSLLIAVNFITQLLVDLGSVKLIDKVNQRFILLFAEVTTASGLLLMAFLPDRLPSPFAGLFVGTMISAMGSGLMEVLISPLIERCPSDHKEAQMGLLHSFYSWGAVAVVLLSTLFFVTVGLENWRILTMLWALVPLFAVVLFSFVPLPPPYDEAHSMKVRSLFRSGVFWLLLLCMVCSGAAEQAMNQWASAFAEAGLGVSKTVGDLAGPCGFSAMMGLSRMLYGKLENKIPLSTTMLGSGVLLVLSYLMVAFAPHPAVGLAGLALCGFSVGIMWPGTLSTGAGALPTAGNAMFAMMALAGDLGCTAGPAVVGLFATDNTVNGMAMLAAIVFPILLVVGLFCIALLRKKQSAGKSPSGPQT